MKIIPVTTSDDLKRFIKFSYRLYKNDKIWVPPLLNEIYGQFNKKRNPTLDHCEYALFILEHNNEIIGRISAFIDRLALDTWKEPIGLFGYYECINDKEASKMLLDTAVCWLKEQGMKYMRGPWSFVSQEWGLVVEGFLPSPTVMAPYNPAYYIEHLAEFDLEKIKDLLVYYISVKEGYTIPDRILSLTDDVKKRYGINVRQIDMKNYDNEVTKVIELSNRSLIDNWGFTSVTKEEAEAVARDLKPIIQPKGVLFAEDKEGRPVGFAITIPDINTLIKGLNGHLFPFGWLKLLWGIPRLKSYRMFALGVLPEYHGKGIDSLLYRALCESLYTKDTWLEINYVLEDNTPMNNAISKLNAKPLRRYRIYQKEIG
ncbi:MAG: GNAT family N-acetyltransferase [Bacteroidales bacterium]|nr:GNAT family N-acetyltransferase [Bacteroidales bacterium]